ncbi:hypothetical protein QL104_07460 [Pseudomonas piscis]|uniref:Uncharacterized protein n=1 Tax=Pseudomonas piscis TaxID=2614538 RepID=A0ABY9NLC1_9PSED|nr:hypothetical protein [Pseudomonas piscis]WMN19236.1 hypothetical protein QL104_07460 [Pseudomonas piscis]
MSKESAELTALASRILTDRRFCSDENHRNLAAGCLALSKEIDRIKEELQISNHACFLSLAENKFLERQLHGLLDANEKLSQHPAPLRAFAAELVTASYEGGSFDGCDIQDIAVRHGLLRIERRDKECGEACACREYGFPIDCYRKTALLDREGLTA